MKYTVRDLPGKSDLKISQLVEGDGHTQTKSDWMIAIGNLCHSDVKGFENYTSVFGWQSECQRPMHTGDGPNTNGLDHSLVTVIIPVLSSLTELETSLYKGKLVDPVSLVKVGTIGYTKVKMQEVKYKGCYITYLQQEFDRVILKISVCEKSNTLFQYDKQGHSQGQFVSTIDFIRDSDS